VCSSQVGTQHVCGAIFTQRCTAVHGVHAFRTCSLHCPPTSRERGNAPNTRQGALERRRRPIKLQGWRDSSNTSNAPTASQTLWLLPRLFLLLAAAKEVSARSCEFACLRIGSMTDDLSI
jgi:hypothetical protein